MKLRTKIYSSYFLTMLILFILVLVTMWKINESQKMTHRISELRMPTATASSTAYSGLHHSLSSLRAWMLLGKEEYKYERDIAWQQEITPSMDTLNKLSVNWTNPENLARLEKVNKLLIQFKAYQQEIEDIANTSANVPSTDMLFNQAAPLAEDLYQNISIIINIEEKQSANTERKKLFRILADTRGSLALMLASIRAYLLSGDDQFKIKTNELWEINTKLFNELENKVALLTSRQQTAYDAFIELRSKFSSLFPKMLKMRSQKDWNLSHYWLATKAAPLGAEIGLILQQMKDNQHQLLEKDQIQIDKDLNRLIVIEWLLMLFGIFISVLAGWFLSKNITQQVGGEPADIMAFAKNVAEGYIDLHTNTNTGILGSLDLIANSQKLITQQADMISNGDYTADISPRSDVDTLGIAMQRMTRNLRKITQAAETIAGGDLNVQINN